MAADMSVSGVLDFKPYKPKQGEEYMNDEQIAHFRAILLDWKCKLMEEVRPHPCTTCRTRRRTSPTPNDRASQESEFHARAENP